MPEYTEEEQRRVTSIEKKLETQANKIEGIEQKVEKIEGIEEKVNTINSSVEELNRKTNTHTETIDTLTQDTTSLKEIRDEYRQMWSQQKIEYDFKKDLRENELDQEIVELLQQKGLETSIDKDILLRLATSKQDLQRLLEKCDRGTSGEDARFLANMSYAYILMAQHYKVAHEHVKAVVSEKEASDYLIMFAWGTFKLALNVGLAVASGGITGVIGAALPFATAASQVDENAKFTGIGNASKEAHTGEAIGTGVSGILGIVEDWITGGSESDDTMIDPYDFFLDKEKSLRKAAAYIANLETKEEREKIKLSLKDDIDEDVWNFLAKEPTSLEELDKGWGEFSNYLTVYMRRLCWRLYCRSQWDNLVFNYTMEIVNKKQAKKIITPRLYGSAYEWPRDVWKTRPKHWEKIVHDFRGPEHNPEHPITLAIGGDAVAKAKEALHNFAYISMATVQCCQIRRHKDVSWKLDLEKSPEHLNHYEILWGNLERVTEEKTTKDYLQNMLAGKGIVVKISEVRLGKLFTHFKSTGKKGLIEKGNDWKSPLMWNNKYIPKITVLIHRTSASTRDAKVGVYKAVFSEDNDKTPELHDGENSCDVKTTKCWWCVNYSDDLTQTKDHPKLQKIDSDYNKALIIKSKSVNYVNFPSSGKLKKYKGMPALFCIKLDPRTNLQSKTKYRKRHFFDTDEFWFKYLHDIEDTRLCPPPKLEIDDDPEQAIYETSFKITLDEESLGDERKIQLYADDELIKDIEITEAQEYKIIFDDESSYPRTGQKLSARIATETSEENPHQEFSAQSKPVEMGSLKPPTINSPIQRRTNNISGTSANFPKGTKIKLKLKHRWSKNVDLGETEVDEDGNWSLELEELSNSVTGGTVYAKAWWGLNPKKGWSESSTGVAVSV